jgi:protocatechuate 3,4-dioxygenase, alpha subunit
VTLPRTPSQTVGPYFAIGLDRRPEYELDGDGVELTGRLLDGRGEPIPDGLVELWDAAGGRWGRSPTDTDGRFRFLVPRGIDRVEAFVHARGLLRAQLTRVYLRGPASHDTQLAREEGGGRLTFDIRMQGDGATVFFDH